MSLVNQYFKASKDNIGNYLVDGVLVKKNAVLLNGVSTYNDVFDTLYDGYYIKVWGRKVGKFFIVESLNCDYYNWERTLLTDISEYYNLIVVYKNNHLIDEFLDKLMTLSDSDINKYQIELISMVVVDLPHIASYIMPYITDYLTLASLDNSYCEYVLDKILIKADFEKYNEFIALFPDVFYTRIV